MPITLAAALILSILAFLAPSAASAQLPRDSIGYVVQMKSGDSFRGNLVDYNDSTLTLATEFGRITVPRHLVDRFIPITGPQFRSPHHFLMPSASPSGPGVFLSDYELGFLYAGFGLGNGATITGGVTLVPGLAIDKQLYHAGAKFTVERNSEYEIALGAAYTFITLDHPYAHIYAVSTFPLGTGRYSGMVMYRVSGPAEAPISLQFFDLDTTRFTVYYPGSLGAAFGFDTPAFGRDDLRWIGEIWNNDLGEPRNTVSMIGIRLVRDHFEADFGLALFTAPFIVPVTRFMWRP